MPLLVASINHRWQLADLCNQRRLLDTLVEIGTHRGVFAKGLRTVWGGKMLYCVDPWEDQPATYLEQVKFLADCNGDRRRDLRETQKNLALPLQFKTATLLQMRSDEAAPQFQDDSVDLVYIDGDHQREGVQLDVDLWWPKIKPGGILAGHDFICPGERDTSPNGWGVHVQPVVLEFAGKYNLDVRLVIENSEETQGHPWSWYVDKPK